MFTFLTQVMWNVWYIMKLKNSTSSSLISSKLSTRLTIERKRCAIQNTISIKFFWTKYINPTMWLCNELKILFFRNETKHMTKWLHHRNMIRRCCSRCCCCLAGLACVVVITITTTWWWWWWWWWWWRRRRWFGVGKTGHVVLGLLKIFQQ